MYYQSHQFTGVIVGSIQPKSWKVMAWPKLRHPNPVWKSDLLRYRWYLWFFWVPWKMRISGVLKIQDPQENHGFTKSWSSTATGWWLGVHPCNLRNLRICGYTPLIMNGLLTTYLFGSCSFKHHKHQIVGGYAHYVTIFQYCHQYMSPVYHYYCCFIPWCSNNWWNHWRNRKIAAGHHRPRNPWWSPARGNQTGQNRPESAATGPWANDSMGQGGIQLGEKHQFFRNAETDLASGND